MSRPAKPVLVPVALSATDVRMLPFTTHRIVGDQVEGEVVLPDNTLAACIVPLRTLRRNT